MTLSINRESRRGPSLIVQNHPGVGGFDRLSAVAATNFRAEAETFDEVFQFMQAQLGRDS